MLDAITKKIAAEGKAEEELCDKFMCYRKHGKGSLETSSAAAEEKNPATLKFHQGDGCTGGAAHGGRRGSQEGPRGCKTAMAEGKALRPKEAEAFAKESSDFKTKIGFPLTKVFKLGWQKGQ